MERILRSLGEADAHGYGGILLMGLGLGIAISPGIGVAVIGFCLLVMGVLLGRAEPELVESDRHAFDALMPASEDVE